MITTSVFKNLRRFERLAVCRNVHYRSVAKTEQVNNGLSELISAREVKSSEDFFQLKDDVIKLSDRFNSVNIDSLVLGTYISMQKLDGALMYIKFLKEQEPNLSLSVLGKLLNVYSHMYENSDMPEEKQNEIFNLFKSMKEQYQHLDSFTNAAVIAVLFKTKHWRVCLDLLEEIKIANTPTRNSYSFAIVAAFQNNEDDIGWNLLEEMIYKNRVALDSCFTAYMDMMRDLPDKKVLVKMNKMLNFFNANEYVCTEEVAEYIKEIFRKLKWTVGSSKISQKGNCNCCNRMIPSIKFKESEFNELKQAFLEKVLVGKDVFRKTTPEELYRFKEFIGKGKKYDVIIDGLNVAYSTGVKKGSQITSGLVASVVEHYRKQNKSILVLGRKHMAKWPRNNLTYIRNNSELLLTQDLSQDDPYLLYCAMNSGVHTVIVSRDLMRSHIYRLENPDHKKAFTRWLSQCQHQLVRVLNNGSVIIKPPLPYLRIPQKLQNVWHVPYSMGIEEYDDNWMCIQMK